MSYRDIVAGNKTAKVVAGRFIQSPEKGTLGIEIAFKFKEGESEEKLNWVGWLTPLAIERTMKTLVEVLGFNGDDEVQANGTLKPEALDRNKDIELVVSIVTEDGKTYPRINWVNNPGGGSAFKTLVPETVKGSLAAVGFRQIYMEVKSGRPLSPIEQGQKKASPLADSDIPF